MVSEVSKSAYIIPFLKVYIALTASFTQTPVGAVS